MVQLKPSYKNNYTLSITPFPDTDTPKKKYNTWIYINTKDTNSETEEVGLYICAHKEYLRTPNAFVAKVWKEIYSIYHTACSFF